MVYQFSLQWIPVHVVQFFFQLLLAPHNGAGAKQSLVIGLLLDIPYGLLRTP